MRAKWSLIFFALVFAGFSAGAQDRDSVQKRPRDTLRQFRIAFDIYKPVLNVLLDARTSYEFAADYYLGRELYAVAEGGWGSALQDYPDLRYKSRNAFFRAGIDKSLLVRLFPGDWDAALFGIRYAYAPVHRGEATYTTTDTIWGGTTGVVPAVTRGVHWGELTAGIRVELVKSLFVGWNIRGRFLFDQNAFPDLRPSFIAGYGQGDKNTVFDFNVWLAYGLRWSAAGKGRKGE